MKDLVQKIKDVREEIYWLEKSKSKDMQVESEKRAIEKFRRINRNPNQYAGY
jgi:hypothetical protein